MIPSRVSSCTIISQYLSTIWSRFPSLRGLFSSENPVTPAVQESSSVSDMTSKESRNQNEISVEIGSTSYEESMQKLLKGRGLFTPLAKIILAYSKKAYFEYEEPGVCATMIHDILPSKTKEGLISLCQDYSAMRLQVVRRGINDEIYYADLKNEVDYITMRFSKMSDKDNLTSMQDLTLQYYKKYIDERNKKEEEEKANMRRFHYERQWTMRGHSFRPYDYGPLSRY